MTLSRATSNRLLRLLRGAPLPIYVLDANRTVVFCNEPLATWLGLELESIVGQQLDYDATGDSDLPAGRLAGLAPAPDAMAGARSAALVSRETDGPTLIYRRAQLLPLGSGDMPGGVMIVLESEDAATPDLNNADEPSTSDALHQQIRQFRVEQQSRYALASLIGSAPAMAQARRAVRAAASCKESILITGPPGSGRSHVARSIHYESADSQSRFVPVACELLDADELLATLRRQLGNREEADAPITLMLADVDSLALDAQLLLEQQLAAASKPLRVISTAARPLIDLAADEGCFRLELARRLTTIEIRLPPLCERLGDLPLLAQLFLEEENGKSPHQVGSFSPESLQTLAEHRWPGNLDELRDAVRQAHQACDGSRIELKHLSLRIRQAAVAAHFPRHEPRPVNLEEFLGQIEAELIQRALAQAQGNKTRAAELLGMTRPRFYRRLEQLGMLPDGESEDEK